MKNQIKQFVSDLVQEYQQYDICTCVIAIRDQDEVKHCKDCGKLIILQNA